MRIRSSCMAASVVSACLLYVSASPAQEKSPPDVQATTPWGYQYRFPLYSKLLDATPADIIGGFAVTVGRTVARSSYSPFSPDVFHTPIRTLPTVSGPPPFGGALIING